MKLYSHSAFSLVITPWSHPGAIVNRCFLVQCLIDCWSLERILFKPAVTLFRGPHTDAESGRGSSNICRAGRRRGQPVATCAHSSGAKEEQEHELVRRNSSEPSHRACCFCRSTTVSRLSVWQLKLPLSTGREDHIGKILSFPLKGTLRSAVRSRRD